MNAELVDAYGENPFERCDVPCHTPYQQALPTLTSSRRFCCVRLMLDFIEKDDVQCQIEGAALVATMHSIRTAHCLQAIHAVIALSRYLSLA